MVADVTDAAPVGIIGAGIVGLAVARQLAGAGVPVVVLHAAQPAQWAVVVVAVSQPLVFGASGAQSA